MGIVIQLYRFFFVFIRSVLPSMLILAHMHEPVKDTLVFLIDVVSELMLVFSAS